jgi:hypothetical protein
MAGGRARVIPGTAFQTGPGTPPAADQLKMLKIIALPATASR